MPSPACQVKDGAGSYAPTTSGVDVTPSNTITINLISSAGVNVWDLRCISTDDQSSASAVTAALVKDNVAKTATFTAPVAGRTYRFQSQINSGVGPDGTAQAAYTTTFCVYTKTSGRRVVAVDETFEGDATFGWTAPINALIRNPTTATVPTGTGFPTITLGAYDAASTPNMRYTGGKLQLDTALEFKASTFTADVLCTPTANRTLTIPDATDTFGMLAATQTFTNKSLTSPTLTGTPTIAAPKINDSTGGQFYIFAVSDLAADRTVTLPLLAANDVFVFEAHTQTLTNKTLTSPKFTGGSFKYVLVGGSLAADRNVSLPVLGADDVFVFQDATQTLTNKTLTSPTLGGTITYSGSATQSTGNARARVYSNIANVQTTDATVTSLFTWSIIDEAVTKMTAEVGGVKSDGSLTAAYVRQLRFKSDGGTVTAGTVSQAYTDEEASASGWDCTIDNSTTTGRVRVTGAAATIVDWGGIMSRLEVTHA